MRYTTTINISVIFNTSIIYAVELKNAIYVYVVKKRKLSFCFVHI